ncbi:hypothetical protein L9F63_012533 [Diploptera punctata]|uniref:C2H2-type domain-containing protein n=1 Tax=Diploptera punctata TaxID=6984 RepID=A0AAD8ACH8_DIPPU|nr:hypothetical protein L9F63_012533 [Diploptera punctata]
MSNEMENVNLKNGEESVVNGVSNNNAEYQNIHCKLEIVSEEEIEEDENPTANPQEKEIDMPVKEENSEPKETTADESMAVEALRQLGGMFDNSTNSVPMPPSTIPHRQHICNICGDTFERKSDLGNHIVCHQVDRPHACRICGNLFLRKADLQNHMVCHQVERPHRCAICGADFQRPSSLTNHMKIHTYLPGRALVAYDLLLPSNTSATTTTTNPENETPPYNRWDVSYTNNMLDSVNCQTNPTESNISNEFNGEENSNQITDPIKVTETQQIEIPSEETTQLCNLNSYEHVVENNNIEHSNATMNFNSGDFADLGLKIENVSCVLNPEEIITAPAGKQSKSPEIKNRRPHICRHCGLSFSREKALKCHMRFHQDYWGNPMECERCEEVFPEETSLQQHRVICRGSKGHQSSQNQVGKHACTECEKKFTTKQKLFRHMWIHRKTPFVCEICGINVGDRATLDEHRRDIHPGESPYKCNECGKSFASRQGLWEHGKIHASSLVTHASPFLCQRCGKTFASRQGHLIHMRTHTGERPYGCRFCWKAFRDGGTLRKHERIHTGERPHMCPLCPKAFNQKVVLREHVRWVHAARNTDGCKICGYVVSDREALCAHIVKHSDEAAAIEVVTVDPTASTNYYPENNSVGINGINGYIPEVKTEFSCDMCGEVFSDRSDLLNHVRIHI